LPLLAFATLGGFLSCGSPLPASPPEATAASTPAPDRFSGEAAWEHLLALVEIGPRVPGAPGSVAARAYFFASLEKLGLEVRIHRRRLEDRGDGAPLEIVNLTGIQPGESSDLVILAAHYDTRRFESFPFVGANDGASGPALLLELARVLRARPLPYTVWFVFLDAEEPQFDAQNQEDALFGSRVLVDLLAREDHLARVRLAVFFDQVADADLTIARDLNSQSAYRDTFFEAARGLGLEEAFPMDAGFDSLTMGHQVFRAAGVRRVVGIADPRYGGDARPGAYWHTQEDTPAHCAPRSLETVGRVAVEGLHEIAARLRNVDRFAASEAGKPISGASQPPEGMPSGCWTESPHAGGESRCPILRRIGVAEGRARR
jgi:hypothetical protein